MTSSVALISFCILLVQSDIMNSHKSCGSSRYSVRFNPYVENTFLSANNLICRYNALPSHGFSALCNATADSGLTASGLDLKLVLESTTPLTLASCIACPM